MTEELVRLFKYAGCSPTACHACRRRIKAGDVFKLQPHARHGTEQRDEMLCAECDDAALDRRDKREARRARIGRLTRSSWAGGYSRPSRQPAKDQT